MNKIKLYNDYSSYLKSLYKERIQKVSIDAGLTCPNRDGSKSTGGCIYCDNETFRPFYCTPEKSISRQITEGITFFSKKYKTQNYFAYFQSYSNTYTSISKLKEICEEALDNQKIIGIILATRPDCIDEEKLQYLDKLAKKYYISIEYGIETFNDKTLALINRHHSCSDISKAIAMTAGRGINIGVHLILGLPGEDYKMIMNNAKLLSKLPVNTIKLHQMQIIKNTKIEELFNKNPDLFIDLSIDKYIDLLIDFIELLDKSIIIERFISEVPVDKLIYPKWGGLKNFEIVSKIEKRMVQRNSCQGSKADF
ncbi:MAG: TIGR01212 family radical SAM protein [Bacteroidales bacterium]|nr:TIGR01212 family radical SAM protein [Bacteroidales bacterium]